jgi:antitoxin component YwqK of YwqJK toxin-antitoxin module
MTKQSFILFAFFLWAYSEGSPSCGPNCDSIHYEDEGHTTVPYFGGTRNGISASYYDDSITTQIEYKNDTALRVQFFYSGLRETVKLKNGVPNGLDSIVDAKSNILIQIVPYADGEESGPSVFFDSLGAKKHGLYIEDDTLNLDAFRLESYSHGMLDGKQLEFSHGYLRNIVCFDKGAMVFSQDYYPSGFLKEEFVYDANGVVEQYRRCSEEGFLDSLENFSGKIEFRYKRYLKIKNTLIGRLRCSMFNLKRGNR